MAYFDFVNSGGSSESYGLTAQGTLYKLENSTNTETVRTLTASGDTHYLIQAQLQTGGASYVPYCKVLVNDTELCNLEGTSGSTVDEYKRAAVFVKSGDVLTVKIKSYKTSSDNHIWIYQ